MRATITTTTTQPSDLAERFRAGDPRAFAQVHDEFHGLVYGIGRRASGSHHEAEEIAQQTFLRAWQSAERFDVGQDLAPWLATIAHRTAVDRYRRRSRFEVVDPGDELTARRVASQADHADSLVDVLEVRRALALLPPAQREVVRLVHVEGLDQATVARRLGVPLGTVKSRLNRAVLALRATFDAARFETGQGTAA